MSLVDRLREVVRDVRRPGSAAPGGSLSEGGERTRRHRNALADILGGAFAEADGHRYLVVDVTYRPGYRHGRTAVADCVAPAPRWLGLLAGGSAENVRRPGPAPARRSLGEGGDPADERLLFLDVETTGLAGGAGTYPFLVGCGWFENGGFHVRQFFLSSHLSERALLAALASAASSAAKVVTYNGKSFDVPLIETRFLFHRLEPPFADLPHIDMLHSARRLWRSDAADGRGCTLTWLEEKLLGHAREDDVPGFEIPARYFHYVRTGDPGPLVPVFEHNRLDLVTLAMLMARAGQLLEEGPAAARTAREAFGLGRLYQRGGMLAAARTCFSAAAAQCATHDEGDTLLHAEALRAFAILARRSREHQEAAAAWWGILQLPRCPSHIAREAAEALAVHHEHRVRDPQAARRFALRSLQFNLSVARNTSLQHRLARLDRKLSHVPHDPSPLF